MVMIPSQPPGFRMDHRSANSAIKKKIEVQKRMIKGLKERIKNLLVKIYLTEDLRVEAETRTFD